MNKACFRPDVVGLEEENSDEFSQMPFSRHGSVSSLRSRTGSWNVIARRVGVQERTEKPSEKDVRFFEAEIRPILVEHCYACHSVDSGNAEGGLRVDSRNAIRKGGSSGAAVVPGDLRASLLVRAIRYNDKEFAMPPADSGGKLSDDKIALLEKWIQRGAPDPREDPQGFQPIPIATPRTGGPSNRSKSRQSLISTRIPGAIPTSIDSWHTNIASGLWKLLATRNL